MVGEAPVWLTDGSATWRYGEAVKTLWVLLRTSQEVRTDLSVACHERSLRFAEGKRKLSRMEAAGVEHVGEPGGRSDVATAASTDRDHQRQALPSSPVSIPSADARA